MNFYLLLGITGDLAKKKVIPALSYMVNSLSDFSGKCADDFYFIGVGRKPLPPTELVQLENSTYISGALDKSGTYRAVISKIKEEIKKNKKNLKKKSNKLSDPNISLNSLKFEHTLTVYSSLPPDMHVQALNVLAKSVDIPRNMRVIFVIEKPVGKDAITSEETIFRLKQCHEELVGKKDDPLDFLFFVDHYLNKEALITLKKIAKENPNLLLHSLGSNNLVEMRAVMYEVGDISSRGSFYDPVGALFDVGQNHLLQLLSSAALIRYEITERKDYEMGKSLRASSAIVESLGRPTTLTKAEFLNALGLNGAPLFGQYEGYRQTEGVDTASTTETFFDIYLKALKTKLTKNEWKAFKNVRFSICSGKKMGIQRSGIELYYANGQTDFIDVSNGTPDAYVNMFIAALKGDQSQFAQPDEIKAGWSLTVRAKKMKTRSDLIVYTSLHDIIQRT